MKRGFWFFLGLGRGFWIDERGSRAMFILWFVKGFREWVVVCEGLVLFFWSCLGCG